MWTPQYDIIVETLTGSEFEVTVTDKDTIGYIKSRIQKYEGIPIGQQHLLYNHKELNDATEMKDIPLGNGSRLKLVLDMKGGPVSARRVINLPDCDNWFDISDVLNTTSRHDPLTISTPGIKFLVCKDKKSFHRIMKFRSDRKNYGATKTNDTPNSTPDGQDDQWVKDNLQTLEKMHQLRTKLDLKKKLKGGNGKSKKDLQSCPVGGETVLHCVNNGLNREVQLSSIEKQLEINPHGPVVKPKPTKRLYSNVQPPTTAEYQTAVISQLMQTDRIGNLCDNFIEEEKKSACGAVNKFGLSKTTNPIPHGLPPPPQSKSKYEKFFQLHALSPPLFSYNLLSKAPECNDIYGKYPPPTNVIKNNFTNLAVNRPKRKPTNNCSEETRSKLRENIRRNRSFKTINANNSTSDEIINRPLATNNSITSILDQLFSSSYSRGVEKKSASKSVQDLVEKLSSSKFASYKQHNEIASPIASTAGGADLSSKAVGIEHERELRLPKRANCLNASSTSNGFENKLFIDRQQTIGLNTVDPSGCASDYKLENSGSTTNSALDGSFRLYKMSTDVKSKYELPKLLIREDSPVESFHSSDPQLETLTIRGESPKNVLDSYPKLSATNTTVVDSTTCDRESKTSNSIIKSPWNSHHHSDLGLNNLELNFLNEEFTDLETDSTSAMTSTENCLQNSGGSVLKIASNLEINRSSWNTAAELEERQSQPSATSLNFINGDLTSSDDDEDVFNSSCCTLHSDPKSKSIELNEFRMMFGSSPTLLNTNYNPVTHTSRLDAVPIQYRRGYSNLNDACLSSSTSDLELFNGTRKKNSSKSASQELPSSFSRHRTNNGSLDFVRSYENLDRTKILRMKNERHRNAGSTCFPDLKPFWDGNNSGNEKQYARERLQEESLCDEPYSLSNLNYDELIRGCMENRSSNKCLPIGFPSDESIFNMNLDRFTDDFNLLSLSDRLSNSSTTNSRDASRSSLVLSELEIDNSVAIKKPLSPSTSVIIKPTKIPISATGTTVSTMTTTTPQKSIQSTSFSTSVIVKPTKIPVSAATPQSSSAVDVASAIAGTTAVQMPDSSGKKPTSGKLRCAECNKKLGLIMIMKCHCGKVFCPQHRYAEAHNCSYNFKSEGKKILARENPLVVAQKLPKI